MKQSCFYFIFVPILFTGCTKDVQQNILSTPVGCDSMEFSYTKNVRPVIVANCSGPACHSGGNSNYDFRTYEVVADRIRSGSFEERLLLPEGDPGHMPKGRNFGKCDLFTLRIWIQQGFKNN